jgi:hypothetical protein
MNRMRSMDQKWNFKVLPARNVLKSAGDNVELNIIKIPIPV